ncbi:MAG: MFS transporter [Beijerinckiaceae bacterium]|jgi:MFS family permease
MRIVLSLILLLMPVFAAIFFLIVGNGLLTTLVPLRAAVEGFSHSDIGWIGSAYFVGMIAGTWMTPVIVRRIGHIRAFSAYASVVAIAALGFPLVNNVWLWMGLRGLCGFAFGGLYGIVESWITYKAGQNYRGRMLGLYNIIHFAGSASGQQFLRIFDPRQFQLFSVSAGFLMAALLPMAVSKVEPPPLPPKGRLIFKRIHHVAPIGLVTIGLVGVANGSFWSLVPAYIEHLGLGASTVATFMTVVILGCATGPYPLGRISDLIDRRGVIVAVSLVAVLVELALAGIGAKRVELLYIFGFLLGIVIPVIYPLTVAHVMDRFSGDEAVVVSSTLLFAYCVGAVIGPIVAAALMQWLGDRALFVHNAAVHAGLAGFVIWRMLDKPPPPRQVDQPDLPEGEPTSEPRL